MGPGPLDPKNSGLMGTGLGPGPNILGPMGPSPCTQTRTRNPKKSGSNCLIFSNTIIKRNMIKLKILVNTFCSKSFLDSIKKNFLTLTELMAFW